MANRGDESGFALLAVILLVALLTISLAVAVPSVIQEIRRDKETEAVHRGQQYARAIRLFYRRTGNYPTDLAQLENTNGIRYLRKSYADPITNSPWKLVYQGEVKPDILIQNGFFGSPSVVQGNSATGMVPGLGVPEGAANYGTNGGVTNIIDPLSGKAVNSSLSDAPAQEPTRGNRRIVGVASTGSATSLRIYKKQTKYSDWQFVYDPSFDGIVGGGQPGANTFSPSHN